MKKRNKIIIIFVVIIAILIAAIVIFSCINFIKSLFKDERSSLEKQWNLMSEEMTEAIIKDSETKTTIRLSDYTDFEWDSAYFVAINYIGGASLAEEIDVACDLPGFHTEGIRRIVFVLNDEVVFDYNFDSFKIDFPYVENDRVYKALILHSEDYFKISNRIKVDVEHNYEIIYLKYLAGEFTAYEYVSQLNHGSDVITWLLKNLDYEGERRFSEVIPLDWDTAYYIDSADMSGEQIEQITGIKNNLEELDSDMRRMVFVKDEKIIMNYQFSTEELVFVTEDVKITNDNDYYETVLTEDDVFELRHIHRR